MTDEEKTKAEPSDKEAVKSPEKSRGPLSYVIWGGLVLVLAIGISFLTMTLLGDNSPAQEKTAEQKNTSAPAGDNPQQTSGDDSLQVGDDPDMLAKIMDNLDFLDYEPSADDIAREEEKMSAEDSVEAVHWLEQEKKRLTKKEAGLDARQRELDVLDKQVSQKILKLEQAESTRITNLAKLYDGMDARAVAKLMANLDDGTVVSILPRMKIKNASAVLSLFPPKRAAKLSKQMITIAEK